MTAMKGAITEIELTEKMDRSSTRVSMAWVRTASSQPKKGAPWQLALSQPSNSNRIVPFCLIGEDWKAPTSVRFPWGETFLAMLGPRPPSDIIEAMLDAADQGARVYLLASPGFASDGNGPGLRDRKSARVLVRRVDGLPCSAWLSHRGKEADIFLGADQKMPPRWRLTLSPNQAEAFYRIFLHLFWHEAEDESFTGEGPLKFHAPSERPFDAPRPGPRSCIRLHSEGEEPWPRKGQVMVVRRGEIPDLQGMNVVLTPPGGIGQKNLAAKVSRGVNVAWEETWLPDLVWEDSGASLKLESAKYRLVLDLDERQTSALGQLLQTALEQPTWRFQLDIPLSKISGDVWLPDSEKATSPVAELSLSCAPVAVVSLKEMPAAIPAKKPIPPVLARSVMWRWTVAPPRLPAGAMEDPLAAEWRRLDDSMNQRLKRVRERLDAIREHEGTIGKAFKLLAGSLLGFGQSREKLLKRLDELQSTTPSKVGPEAAPDLLTRVREIEQETERLEGNLTEAERKAKEEQERQKQEAEWKAGQEKARSELEAIEKDDLPRNIQERSKKEAEIVGLGGESLIPKDIEARRRKLENDLERVRKVIAGLENKKASLRDRIAVPFEFNPARQVPVSGGKKGKEGGRFIPQATPIPVDNVPDEALPGTGQLFLVKDRRYLVIERWEQLDAGESEAARLKANLVAPMEAK